MRLHRIRHQFVEFVPEKLEPGTLYISLEYNSASHLCACGCGYEVVTILGPADSSITYNGRGISISTSIGNSNFPCKSHYWIDDNRIVWESKMTPQLTALSRARDKKAKAREYGVAGQAAVARSPEPQAAAAQNKKPTSWWRKLLD
ncbi:MAG TPA: DUF6527 family protein [Candidatus Paceibacterota bacterium]|nr:DUF6527 family protein [Candidatus Paceibacterota bacterium]